MGISSADWLQLWNGVVGAALSAVLAALVAVFVVWRTNKYQGKQSALARSDAYVQSEKALRVQREGLERQLQHQMMESRRADTVRSLANFVAPVEALYYSPIRAGADVDSVFRWREDLHLRMTSALQELKMVGEYAKGSYALLAGWPEALSGLGFAITIAKAKKMPHGHLEEVFMSACKILVTDVPRWLDSGNSEQSVIAQQLQAHYDAAHAVLEKRDTPD